jgi:hypothetical protein
MSFETYLDGRLILVTKAQHSDPFLVDETLVLQPSQVEHSREHKGLSLKPSRSKCSVVKAGSEYLAENRAEVGSFRPKLFKAVKLQWWIVLNHKTRTQVGTQESLTRSTAELPKGGSYAQVPSLLYIVAWHTVSCCTEGELTERWLRRGIGKTRQKSAVSCSGLFIKSL